VALSLYLYAFGLHNFFGIYIFPIAFSKHSSCIMLAIVPTLLKFLSQILGQSRLLPKKLGRNDLDF